MEKEKPGVIKVDLIIRGSFNIIFLRVNIIGRLACLSFCLKAKIWCVLGDCWETSASCSLSGPRSGPRSFPGFSNSPLLDQLVFPVMRCLYFHRQQKLSIGFTMNIHTFLLAYVASACYLSFSACYTILVESHLF